jgi:hypothetical protein
VVDASTGAFAVLASWAVPSAIAEASTSATSAAFDLKWL